MVKNCGTCKSRIPEDREWHYMCSSAVKNKRVRKDKKACRDYIPLRKE